MRQHPSVGPTPITRPCSVNTKVRQLWVTRYSKCDVSTMIDALLVKSYRRWLARDRDRKLNGTSG